MRLAPASILNLTKGVGEGPGRTVPQWSVPLRHAGGMVAKRDLQRAARSLHRLAEADLPENTSTDDRLRDRLELAAEVLHAAGERGERRER